MRQSIELQGYDLSEELHRGKSTVVLRGTRQRDSLPVVVKALSGPANTFAEVLRLRHEQAIIESIKGTAVVRSYGIEKQHRVIAIVLEDFGGVSLGEFLAVNRLDIPGFLRIAIQLSAALQEIHSAHVIHLDINSSNIIINPHTLQVKVIDFGISSQLSSELVTTVSPNVLEGTLPYISPEQTGRMNRSVDYRADFYSLGVTLYEALLGWVPFQSTDSMELLHCHIAKPPLVPADLNSAIPKPISDIVVKLLAKTAEDRYQSASGLRADLEHCLLRWQTEGRILEFPLGESDISERLQIPQRLYGRDTAIASLVGKFHHACKGHAGMLLVSGEAGVGKSALVHEVYRPIVLMRGFFISGKFDQFRRNVPYGFAAQALRELVDQLLAASSEDLAQWRSRLQSALGSNGAVLTGFIPEIELIVGEQPPLQDLPPKESQNRFNGVIQRFVRAVAGEEHPLVLFLDDLQWADQASLDLIQLLLTDPDLKFFFLIGAFRDDEVPASHPLALMNGALKAAGVEIPRITLSPLEVSGVNQLVADTLRLGADECRPLSDLLISKTAGNPFFVNEFLKSLDHDGLLRLDREARRWMWDIGEIRQKDITENVVTMMTGNIRRLPLSTQECLQVAACIGNTFHLAALARVRKCTPASAAEDLWPAIKTGLIIPRDDSYKYIQNAGESESVSPSGSLGSFAEVTYRFAHDRVQQAAYSLIPPGRASRLHHEIGLSLLENREESDRGEVVFAAADHMNLGREHIVEAERHGVIQLNLLAGRRAKASAAFEPALRYFSAAFAYIAPGDVASFYELHRDLLMEKGECEYLTGDFAGAERTFASILDLVRTPAEKGRAMALTIELYIHRGQLDRAIETASTALKVLGVSLPITPGKLTVFREMAAVRWRLGSRKIADLINLPAMSREEPRVAMKILMSLFGIAYSLSEESSGLVISKMMNLTLRYGNADVSAFTYGIYGLLVSAGFRAYDAGRELSNLGLRLSEQFQNRLLQGRCNFVSGCLHNHWSRHASTNREYLQEAYRHATESGDLLYASYAMSQQSIVDIVTGVPLPTVHQNASDYLVFVERIQHTDIAFYFEATMHWAATLMGKAGGTGLSGGEGGEAGFLKRLEQSGYAPPKMFFQFITLQLCYLRGDHDAALEVIERSESIRHALIGQLVEAEYLFFHSLTLLALARGSSPVRRKTLLRKVVEGQKRMKRWAELCPENFGHKHALVAAEIARVRGNIEAAMRHYDDAIAGARAHEYIQHEGLANELAGEFYLAMGREKVASSYLSEARACYEVWGATGLVRLFDQRYALHLPLSGGEGQSARSTTHRTAATTRTQAQALDLITVLKASQALSGEILLPQLLDRMMKIVLENAGAQRGFLIMEKGDRLVIEAEGEVGSVAPLVLQSVPVENSGRLSESIVRYVARLREYVVVDDAGSEGKFMTDPYILQMHPKSILSMPILHQGKLSGILYLENNLSVGAFTPARLEVLRLLSSQIAVSMENARLYAQERELVRVQEEIRLAARIQRELLPSRPPSIPGYEIIGVNNPAQTVGGDYFDFIRIDDHRLAICIGDVSGKGLPASLLMANLQASLRGQSMLSLSPREILTRSNRLLYESTSPEKFATVFYGILDTASHRLWYCNGGHEYPLVLSASGEIGELVAGGTALGLLESFPYEEGEVPFLPGDLLVMYSDGITEAMNSANEQFGRVNLDRILVEQRHLPLDGLAQKVVEAVKRHAGAAPQSDDITLVAVRRTALSIMS